MSIGGQEKPWMCAAGAVNLRRVGSIVRDIGEPCLQHSPTKGKKMLKPGRWHATFDSDGKIIGFNKILKLIILGGVDPSIRAEVWEFLLGCYSIGSTAESRWQLRMARRERYNDLLKKCQMMHSSVGTGRLAYAVGSKIMDVRKMSCDACQAVPTVNSDSSRDASSEIERPYEVNNDHMDVTCTYETNCLGGSADTACVKERIDYATYDSPSENYSFRAGEMFKSEYSTDSYFDFPPLPVTDLFEKSKRDEKLCEIEETTFVTEPRWMMNDEDAHNFQTDGNINLTREDEGFTNLESRLSNYEDSNFDAHQIVQAKNLECHRVDKNGMPYDREMTVTDSRGSCDAISDEGRVADWLWTLHRIVVDVVRTDSHLEFYGDTKNIARMSDILAVYAWVDPATGYCQGMSDLLSPFVILYEDNADAFWCFEMLLRRMRQNFHMEGPTGVMKQLEALGRILELTDFEMFNHLSVIGAESLLFAFRMLLVLFRRELSFNEALCMWEMMWAAEFDEATSRELADNCLDPLILHLPQDITCTTDGNTKQHSKNSPTAHANEEESASGADAMRPVSMIPFCGFKPSNFWTRNNHWQTNTFTFSPLRNGDDDLVVFCVAAILILNRSKIIKQACSMDDVIKMFNDKKLEINAKRCVRLAIRLRKKYFYKLMKQSSNGSTEV